LVVLALRNNPIVASKDDRFQILQMLHTRYPSHGLKIFDYLITEKERVAILANSEQIKQTSMEESLIALALKYRIPSSIARHHITDIDMRGCGLKRFDVSPFVNLRQLLLCDNFLSSTDKLTGTDVIATSLQVCCWSRSLVRLALVTSSNNAPLWPLQHYCIACLCRC
jgi:hypothetical protein